MISHGIFPILTPNFPKFVCFLSPLKLRRNLESPHFPMFSPKCRQCKIRKREMVMEKSWKKYFVKYVGTLNNKLIPPLFLSSPHQVFKHLFKDGLEIQRDRIRELRRYAKEEREHRAERQQNELESIEN